MQLPRIDANGESTADGGFGPLLLQWFGVAIGCVFATFSVSVRPARCMRKQELSVVSRCGDWALESGAGRRRYECLENQSDGVVHSGFVCMQRAS